jgi:hypothetical protein
MRHNTGWFTTPFPLTSFPEASCDPRSLPQPALLRPSPLRSSVCRPHPCHASWRWCSLQLPSAAQPEEAAAMLRPGGTARTELSSRCRSGCRTRKLTAPASLPLKHKNLSDVVVVYTRWSCTRRYYLQLALCEHFRSQRRRLHVDGLPHGIWLIGLPGHPACLPPDEWLQPVLDGPQF